MSLYKGGFKRTPLKMTGAIVYSLLDFYLLLQFWLHCRSQHNKLSFKMGFIILCLLWVTTRALFWIEMMTLRADNSDNQNDGEIVVFMLSPTIQFATFAYLCLFYQKILTDIHNLTNGLRLWAKYRRSAYCIYTIMVMTFGLLSGLLAITPHSDDEGRNRFHQQLWHFVNSLFFFILAFAFLFYSYRMNQIKKTHLQKVNLRIAICVNIIIVICFTFRAGFDLVMVIWPDLNTGLSQIPNKDITSVTLVEFAIWELLPTLLLLVTIANEKGGYEIFHSIGARRNFIFCPCSKRSVSGDLSSDFSRDFNAEGSYVRQGFMPHDSDVDCSVDDIEQHSALRSTSFKAEVLKHPLLASMLDISQEANGPLTAMPRSSAPVLHLLVPPSPSLGPVLTMPGSNGNNSFKSVGSSWSSSGRVDKNYGLPGGGSYSFRSQNSSSTSLPRMSQFGSTSLSRLSQLDRAMQVDRIIPETNEDVKPNPTERRKNSSNYKFPDLPIFDANPHR